MTDRMEKRQLRKCEEDGCFYWLRSGVSQQWSGVDMAGCWWKSRVLTSGGDGPSPAAGQERVDSAG